MLPPGGYPLFTEYLNCMTLREIVNLTETLVFGFRRRNEKWETTSPARVGQDRLILTRLRTECLWSTPKKV